LRKGAGRSETVFGGDDPVVFRVPSVWHPNPWNPGAGEYTWSYGATMGPYPTGGPPHLQSPAASGLIGRHFRRARASLAPARSRRPSGFTPYRRFPVARSLSAGPRALSAAIPQPRSMILSNEMLLAQMNWRYATKKFDPLRKIPDATWTALEQVLVLSPSSYGLQPWRFLIIRDPQLRLTLRTLTRDQPQLTDCSHFVVFARKNRMTEADVDKLISLTAERRGLPRSSLRGYQDLMIEDIVKGPRSAWVKEWTARQTYIALGNLLTSAALLGIDACPMEGLDPAGYDAVLGLAEKGYSTVCVCALGYRAADDRYANAKKVRYEFSEVSEQR
jgi:nitroreductase